MKSNLFPISSVGFQYIAIAFVAFVFFSILDIGFLALVALVFIAIFVSVFRNPERELPLFAKGSCVSPVDGKVISIQNIQDSEHNNSYAYKIEIDSTYFDVGILRIPFDAILQHIAIEKGTRLATSSPLFKDLNENTELIFRDENANSVLVQHQLKKSFDCINIDIRKDQNLKQALRYGTMINGVTSIYLPKNFRLNVALGAELKGSQTLVGYFS